MSDDNISFWPPFPEAGSNAFGEFSFGKSPFGTIQSFDWKKTVISQYANSTTMMSMIDSWWAAIDQTQDIDLFFTNVWNISTASGYGLDIWGAIVGVNRNLQVNNSGNYFGFIQGVTWDNMAPGGLNPFYSGQPLTSNYTLTDNAYRQLILAKALANICDGSILSLNAILMTLFGPTNPFGPGGQCHVTDGQNMTMTITFNFHLTPVQTSIIYNSGVLPLPCGVAVTIVVP